MAAAKEESELELAIEESMRIATRGMRGLGRRSVPYYHTFSTEPIAKNGDCWSLETSRLPLYQRSQSMGNVEYRQKCDVERFKVHFTGVELIDGDTLVFVDFPTPPKGKAPPVDCSGMPFPSQKLRVHSEKLLATGSSRFADMFQPSYQFRIQRRRKLVNQLPEGVKYVLDLTPPPEGDEMVFQIAELSLSPGIIKWWSSYARLDVPFFLVKGHDDVCPCKDLTERSMAAALMEPVSLETAGSEKDLVVTLPLSAQELVQARDNGRELQVQNVPAHFNIPDYCPIRHRNGIIRLLMLIEGREVFINSAARLWTIVALAKIWDCVSVVQDPAIQWMLQGKNSKFIEVLPEEAIRIGDIIENPHITRTAFRILVNELAFEQTASDRMKETVDFRHVTLFGRRKGDPGDEFINLIQHAALAFVERITNRLRELQSPDIFEAWNLPEHAKILKLEESLKSVNLDSSRHVLERIATLKTKLRSALAGSIDSWSKCYSQLPSVDGNLVDSDRAKYVEPQDFRKFMEIYADMTPLQKLLTPYPYKQLELAWAGWVGSSDRAENSRNSMTEAADLDALYEFLKNRPPWDGDGDRELWDLLSDSWLEKKESLYPQMPEMLDSQVRSKLDELGSRITDNDQDLQTLNTKHLLLTLTSNETKFLHLWAGGLNDGTGGVFEVQLPPADMGPNGPGPAYHTGTTIPSDASSLSGSFLDDMSALNMAGSYTASSVDMHDSVSTVYRPDQVIADDKSIASESFQLDAFDYHEARGIADAAAQGGTHVTPQSLDEFLQDTDSDSDSAATIGYDDFDALDNDEDLYASSQLDSAADHEVAAADAVAV